MSKFKFKGAFVAMIVGLVLLLGQASSVRADSGWPYRVQPGDSLSAISQRFGVPLRDLVVANGLTSPDAIYIGQVLLVPTPSSFDGFGWGPRRAYQRVRKGFQRMPVVGGPGASRREPGGCWVACRYAPPQYRRRVWGGVYSPTGEYLPAGARFTLGRTRLLPVSKDGEQVPLTEVRGYPGLYLVTANTVRECRPSPVNRCR